MATLYISEFWRSSMDAMGQPVPAPDFDALVAEQNVNITPGSTQSNALNPNTRFVLLVTDATCSLAYGTNPTAVTAAHRMKQDDVRFYGASGGNKIAVISNV